MAENRMLSDEILLGLIKANSGGGGGTTDYEDLNNLPKVNSVELKGNKSLSDLGIASAQSVTNITNGASINNFAGVEDALSNVQILDGVVDPSGSVGKDKNLYVELSGSIPSAMKVTSLKFEVTARRGGGTGMIEYSRLGFYDAEGNKYNWPQGTTWSSNVQTAENDPIGSSKMLQYSIPAVTTINLPGGEYIDTSVYNMYGWNTGNYSGENCQRDPVSWKLYLSEDKTNYILRDVRSNQTITTSRNTLAFKDEFNILPPEFPSISDIFYKKGGVWLKDAFAQQPEVDAIKDGQSIDSFADVETALADVETALSGKQDTLTFDDTPTDGSNNPVKSNGIYDALATKADTDIVASDFDATASYTAGNYCVQDGKLYKFKNNHSGAWSSADVDEIKIAGELSALKSGLTNVDVALSAPEGSGKNVLPMSVNGIKELNTGGTWNGNTYTINGGTFTIQTDSNNKVISIIANGTFTDEAALYILNGGNAPVFERGKYILNGVTGGSANTYNILYASASWSWHIVENGDRLLNEDVVRLRINAFAGTLDNVVFYPMIRPASVSDPTFAPYIPSVESRIEAVESGLIDVTGCIGWSKRKNLMPLNTRSNIMLVNDNATWSDDTCVIGDATFTFTFNEHDVLTSIKVEGNGTALSADVTLNVTPRVRRGLYVPNGDYIFSGCPANGSASTYRMFLQKVSSGAYGTLANDTGSEASFTVDNSIDSIICRIALYKDYIIPSRGLMFYPMIRPASISDSTFEPAKPALGDFAWDTSEKIPYVPNASGTYTLKATRSANGLVYSWVADT